MKREKGGERESNLTILCRFDVNYFARFQWRTFVSSDFVMDQFEREGIRYEINVRCINKSLIRDNLCERYNPSFAIF